MNSYRLPDNVKNSWPVIIIWGTVGMYILIGGYLELSRIMREGGQSLQQKESHYGTQ